MHSIPFRFPAAILLASIAVAAIYLVLVFRNRSIVPLPSASMASVNSQPAELPPWLAPTPPGLRIHQFYASTGTLVRGDTATICYGTANAVRLALEPPIRVLSPARNRCFAVSPERDTTYRLLAWDASGNVASEAFTIHVVPAPAHILFVDISRDSIRRGERPNICYGVVNATKVTLKPMMQPLPVREKYCAVVAPAVTTRFSIEAKGPGGNDQLSFTIKVN